MCIEEHVQYIQRLVSSGGPREEDYPGFTEWVGSICECARTGRLAVPAVDSLRAAFGDAFSPATMQGFAYTKPHGYAGDYEIIERIYQTYICPDAHLSAWDRYWQNHSAAKAVRNRKIFFHKLLNEHSTRTVPLRVLKIASGPGRSMYEWLSANPDANVHFECVEIDAKAINYAARLNERFLDRITFVQKNALRYRPTTQYDLIWAAGIFDYFNDRVFAGLLQRLLPAIASGGELVVGNFSDQNPSRPYMELFDWVLYHRNEQDLISLAQQCGVPRERLAVDVEPEGVNLFLHIRPN